MWVSDQRHRLNDLIPAILICAGMCIVPGEPVQTSETSGKPEMGGRCRIRDFFEEKGRAMDPTYVIIPGMGGSGPDHWQTRWEKDLPNTHRVIQRDWDQPILMEWVMKLEQDLAEIEGPKVLIGHSLGSIVTVEATYDQPDMIKGALLVAPPDLAAMEGAGEMPMHKMPYPSILVASENDPWVSVERAEEFARAWGSEFVNIGQAGHINAESKMGDWYQGQFLLRELMKQ